MKRLYGNVPEWNVDEEYHVLRENVEHFEALHQVQKAAGLLEIFKGSNG